MLPWCNVLARLHIYAVLRWCNVLARLRNYVTVVHMRSEWTRKVRVRGKTKVAGTQQIDRCWNHLKEICPSQMKNRTGPTINARFWDRIYQWIYRHNMSKWDMTTTCKMKKRLLKLFVIWCRNCSWKKWQNVMRFGTWMSKTHGCVNPCCHVYNHALFERPHKNK